MYPYVPEVAIEWVHYSLVFRWSGCKSVAENRLLLPRDFGFFLISYMQLISKINSTEVTTEAYRLTSCFNIKEHCILSTQNTHVILQ